MEYPKRVRVVYADGAEEMGTAIDPRHVDVGPMGLQVRRKEIVVIDGVSHLVADARRNPQSVEREEASVRLRLKPTVRVVGFHDRGWWPNQMDAYVGGKEVTRGPLPWQPRRSS
jgi:hypothetical protein